MSQIFQEVPAEILRSHIHKITGDNSVLLTAGNLNLFDSTIASCRFAEELSFVPVAVCFIRPQKHMMRFIDKNNHFTLSYFAPEQRHMLDFFRSGNSAGAISKKFVPLATQSGNIYYPQSRLVLECRKVYNLEIILSQEIQSIMAAEQARTIYPGNEVPRMYVGEIEHCWLGVQALLNM